MKPKFKIEILKKQNKNFFYIIYFSKLIYYNILFRLVMKVFEFLVINSNLLLRVFCFSP